MEISDFTEKFGACLQHMPAAGVNPSVRFKKMDEWSSILALIVIAMVDSEYDKVMTSEDIHKADTIQDLFEIIQSR